MQEKTHGRFTLSTFQLILWDPGHPLGYGTRYSMGSGPLILWDPDHLSSEIRITYPLGSGPHFLWDPDHLPLEPGPLILCDPDHLSSGILTAYPLGFVRWNHAVELRYNPLANA